MMLYRAIRALLGLFILVFFIFIKVKHIRWLSKVFIIVKVIRKRFGLFVIGLVGVEVLLLGFWRLFGLLDFSLVRLLCAFRLFFKIGK